jgi:hypothetical protein
LAEVYQSNEEEEGMKITLEQQIGDLTIVADPLAEAILASLRQLQAARKASAELMALIKESEGE